MFFLSSCAHRNFSNIENLGENVENNYTEEKDLYGRIKFEPLERGSRRKAGCWLKLKASQPLLQGQTLAPTNAV